MFYRSRKSGRQLRIPTSWPRRTSRPSPARWTTLTWPSWCAALSEKKPRIPYLGQVDIIIRSDRGSLSNVGRCHQVAIYQRNRDHENAIIIQQKTRLPTSDFRHTHRHHHYCNSSPSIGKPQIPNLVCISTPLIATNQLSIRTER
jgi:hypothetical protein